MRIAYLTQSYPPMISGAAISAQQTAESMAQRGHQVLVIAASDRKGPYHTYKDNLSVLRVRSLKNPMRVGQRMIAFPRRDIMKALCKFKPDVIHTHEPLQVGMLRLEYAQSTHIPVTVTVHQLPRFVASYFPESLKPFIEGTLWTYARWLVRKYDSIIVPTQTISKIMKQKTGTRSDVIGFGLDLQMFHPPLASHDESAARTRLGLPSNVPVILHVGRLDADKRVEQVIRAAAQAMHETSAHLLIVGDGCQKQNLIRLCKELRIENRVYFAGYVSPQNGLMEIYRIATVFVTASEIETQGIVLLEAAASGLPIVAVNATCIPEIVHDRVNGFLAHSGDIQAFKEALITLLNNHKKARTMGREGRILAEEHGVQYATICHEKLYQDMVRQMRAQRANDKVQFSNPWKVMKTWMGFQ